MYVAFPCTSAMRHSDATSRAFSTHPVLCSKNRMATTGFYTKHMIYRVHGDVCYRLFK